MIQTGALPNIVASADWYFTSSILALVVIFLGWGVGLTLTVGVLAAVC